MIKRLFYRILSKYYQEKADTMLLENEFAIRTNSLAAHEYEMHLMKAREYRGKCS